MCLKWPSFVGIVVISLDAFLISFSVLRVPRKEIVIQCPTSHIVQVKRPGLAPFGIDQGNASSPLVNVALIHTQRRDFTDAQSCPIAQREDGSYPMGGVVLHQLVEHHALFPGEFGRSHGHHGWTLHQASGIATEIALIHCPLAEAAQPGKRLAAGPWCAACALEPIHIATNRRLRHQPQMERCPSWLHGQSGYKVTHRGQICGDRFGITSRESSSKLLERSRIIASRGHLSFPNFEPKRFSDKNLRLTSAFSLVCTTKLSVEMGGAWPRMAILSRAFPDKLRANSTPIRE